MISAELRSCTKPGTEADPPAACSGLASLMRTDCTACLSQAELERPVLGRRTP